MEFLKGFLDIHSIIGFAFGLVPTGYFVYRLTRFIIRKEIRLFRNLERKVYLIRTGEAQSLAREQELIQSNGLFIVNGNILDARNDTGILDTITKSSVIVVGYSKVYENYSTVIARARRDQIPVIVIASPGEIIEDHMKIFRDYPYFEMCNTSSRLLTTIFNLSAIAPYVKK